MNETGQMQVNNQSSFLDNFDITKYLQELFNNILVIILAAIVCGTAAFAYTYLFTKPEYSSSVLVYINKSTVSFGGTDITLSSSDSLSGTYSTILKSRTTLEEIAATAGVDYTTEQLSSMISATEGATSSFMTLKVTCGSPTDAELIANTIAEVLPTRVSDIVDGSTLRVVDYAVVPSSRTTDSLSKNFFVGLAGGAIAVCIFVFLKLFLESYHAPAISSASELSKSYQEYPLLGVIGDMSIPEKKYSGGTHGYGDYSNYYSSNQGEDGSTDKGSKKKQSKDKENSQSGEGLICEKVSFRNKEEYKRVRTNIRFCLDADLKSAVIGITSAQPSDGKTLTAINLAYAMAQLQDKKTLIIDCDMRKPTVGLKLGFDIKPGLSNVLSKVDATGEVIHEYVPSDGSSSFSVLTAGEQPPNPAELLSGARMRKLMDRLKGQYDFIILDLPPVGAVTDAQNVSDIIDGMMVVLRESYCTKPVMDECLHQLEMTNTRVLGFLLNGSTETAKGSYKYKKYSKYGNYRKYYGGYGNYGYYGQDSDKTTK